MKERMEIEYAESNSDLGDDKEHILMHNDHNIPSDDDDKSNTMFQSFNASHPSASKPKLMQPDERKGLVLMQRMRVLRKDQIARRKEERVRTGRRDIIGWRRRIMRRIRRDGRINERLIWRMGEVGVRGGRFVSGCRMGTLVFLVCIDCLHFSIRTTINVCHCIHQPMSIASVVHKIQ